MFHAVTLRGGRATLVWGYRTAAVLRTWTIRKHDGHWTLRATLERADRFQCRQAMSRKELRFTAPRTGGYWCWPLVGDLNVGTDTVVGKLGPPEQ